MGVAEPIPVEALKVVAEATMSAAESLVLSLIAPAVAVTLTVFAVPPVPAVTSPNAISPAVPVISIVPAFASTKV